MQLSNHVYVSKRTISAAFDSNAKHVPISISASSVIGRPERLTPAMNSLESGPVPKTAPYLKIVMSNTKISVSLSGNRNEWYSDDSRHIWGVYAISPSDC